MIIYKTTNLINNKIYIGQDTNNNPKYLGSGLLIRRAFEKYGIENFKKEILEICETKEFLCEREKYWIAFYNSRIRSIGYNITGGGEYGDTISMHPDREEICKRMSIGRTGKKVKRTLEHNKKISESQKGKTIPIEQRLKIAKTLTGRKASLETRQKLSELHKDKKLTDEHKVKISNAKKGKKQKPLTEEHKEKISNSNKGRKLTPEQRQNISNGMKGKKYSPERIAKMIATKLHNKLAKQNQQTL